MNRYTKYLSEIAGAMAAGTFALRRRPCPACERRTWFLISGSESRSIRCLSCRATAISLACLEQIRARPLDPSHSAVYELSYHGAVFDYLKRHYSNFHFSEYFGPQAGPRVNGVRNEDVQRLTFADEQFDLVSSTEVFEHVPNYLAGFAEVRRVLREGGSFVFTVPMFDAVDTKLICRLGADGQLDWAGEPEYHDSQVTGVNSVPVFWHHSKAQIVRDLLQAGFAHAEVVESCAFSDQVVQQVVTARR